MIIAATIQPHPQDYCNVFQGRSNGNGFQLNWFVFTTSRVKKGFYVLYQCRHSPFQFELLWNLSLCFESKKIIVLVKGKKIKESYVQQHFCRGLFITRIQKFLKKHSLQQFNYAVLFKICTWDFLITIIIGKTNILYANFIKFGSFKVP